MTSRPKGAELSYLQLIEVAVVAGCRKAGLSLRAIRAARDYVSRELNSEYPFAEHQFATDGKRLMLQFDWSDGDEPRKWLSANEKGQLAWDEVIGRTLKSFDYEKDLAVRWHVGGEGSNIIIDPRIAFGAPSISGRPTWIFKDRWSSGEPLDDTADDFQIPVADIKAALQFEGVDIHARQPQPWLN